MDPALKAEFDDVEPIAQADPDNALVPIAYAPDYREAMDLFRAVVAKEELSQRALKLTESLVRLNPGHFTVWAYRARILVETQCDLTAELELMDALVKEHLKSYQVWQHRRTIVTALDSPERELPFVSKALSYDSKNYHTWAYRQWVLCHFFSPSKAKTFDESIWRGELAYIDELLTDDIRNNSAWNHRYWVTFESAWGASRDRRTAYEEELAYVKSQIALAPNNASAWNYLRGIMHATETPLSSLESFARRFAGALESEASKPVEDAPVSSEAELPATLAIEFLADAAEGEESAQLFRALIEYDPIRTHYWNWRASEAVSAAA